MTTDSAVNDFRAGTPVHSHKEKAAAEQEMVPLESVRSHIIEEVLRMSSSEMKPKQRATGYPLAMFAFGMSNILLGQRVARTLSPDSIAIAQGTFYAGVGQTLAGVFAFCNGDTIGTFLAAIFGSWWYSLAATNLPPILKWSNFDNQDSLMAYNLIWAFFLFLNCIVVANTVPKNVCSLASMVSVTLTAGAFGVSAKHPDAKGILVFAGVFCIAAGVFAVYIAAAVFLEETYGHPMIPLGYPFRRSRDDTAKSDEERTSAILRTV